MSTQINLKQPSAALFDSTAEHYAKQIAQEGQDWSGKEKNKSTQLRKFYDEVVMWEQKLRLKPEETFNEYLPLIRMVNAKVAYAEGRKLVSSGYRDMMKTLLSQVDDKASFTRAKLFLEAFMGFYKLHAPTK